MVSASTSPNQTRKFGVKFCPVSSNIATSPPPFNWIGGEQKRKSPQKTLTKTRRPSKKNSQYIQEL